jgi:tetratricopeptide (TPR) repeat protein
MNKYLLFAATAALLSSASFAQTDSSAVYLQKAIDEKAKGRRMEAIKSLEKAQTLNKNNKQVVNELAASYLDVRMLAKAKAAFQQLETIGGATADTYRQLMNLNFNMRQFNDAIRYAELVQKSSTGEKVAYIIGRSYYEMDDLGNSIKYLESAIKEDPSNSQVPHLLAMAYTNMQNFKQAIPYFEKAIALEPANNRFLYEMALAYYGMGDDKNALRYMLEAGEKGYKKDSEYMQNLSTALMNAGKFSEGLDIMKKALEKRPSDIGLIDMIAEACYDAGKFDDAISFYNKILAIDEKKAEALYMMGMAYQKKGTGGKWPCTLRQSHCHGSKVEQPETRKENARRSLKADEHRVRLHFINEECLYCYRHFFI